MKYAIALRLMAFSTMCTAVNGCGDEGAVDRDSLAQSTHALTNYTALFQDTSTMRDGAADWDALRGKASCATKETISAMSEVPGGAGRRALCKGDDLLHFGGNAVAVLTLDAGTDQQRATHAGDWAFNYWKLECGFNEYISGVSENATQYQGNNRFHSIRCATGSYLSNSCSTRTFDNGDDRGSTLSGDWDSGAYKGECREDEYAVGVSVDPVSGRPHSLLCCYTLQPSGGGGHQAAP